MTTLLTAQRYLAVPIPTAENGGLYAYVYLPPNAKDLGPLPISIQIHGGGHLAGCSREFAPDALAYLLEHGFAVVGLAYRLLPQVSIDDQRQDLIDGYGWVLNTLPGLVDAELDTSRCYVTGNSAGATLAAYFTNDILRPPTWLRLPPFPSPLPLMKAAVLVYGNYFFDKAFQSVSAKVLEAVKEVKEKLLKDLEGVGEVSSVPYETFETTKEPVLLLRHKFGGVYGSMVYTAPLNESEYPSSGTKVDPTPYMSQLLFPKSSRVLPSGQLEYDDFLTNLHMPTSLDPTRTTPIGFLNATLDKLVLPGPNSAAYHEVLKKAGVETEKWDAAGDHGFDFHDPEGKTGGTLWVGATRPSLDWAIAKTRA